MKTRKYTLQLLSIITSALVFATPGTSRATSTAPSKAAVSTETGFTSVALDPGLVAALDSLGVKLSRLAPGTFVSAKKGTVSFPIVGGVFDPASTTTTAEILHRGGLVFSAGGTDVVVSNFIIQIPADGTPATLTGLVTAKGILIGRVPLFKVGLGDVNIESKRYSLRVSNVALTLTKTAADALNAIFQVGAFAEDAPVGIANVSALALPLPSGGNLPQGGN